MLTRNVTPLTVLHYARSAGYGEDGLPIYQSPRQVDWLLPLEVREAVAPDFARAKLELNIAKLGIHAWQWKNLLALDDRIAIVQDFSEGGQAASRTVLFTGFVLDVDVRFDNRSEAAIVTCAGPAFRLSRDLSALVYGRWMKCADGTVRHFSGLRCEFNAGGVGNMAADYADDLDDNFTFPGTPVFTFDGDPAGKFWTHYDCWRYLQRRYFSPWLSPDEMNGYAGSPSIDKGPLCVSVEGQHCWRAMASVADRSGFDVCEEFYAGDSNVPKARTKIVLRHYGSVKTVRLQKPGSKLDLGGEGLNDQVGTNLFSGSIAQSCASATSRPTLAGGAELVEITVELQQAWNFFNDPPPGMLIDPPVGGPNGTTDDKLSPYALRYVKSGGDDSSELPAEWSKFPLYCDVGRLWDANTDGSFSGVPFNLAVTDLAVLAGYPAGSWPRMNFKPLACLSLAGQQDKGAFVQLSFDGGTTWQHVSGYEMLPDRLGIRFTGDNMAGYCPLATDPYADVPLDDNLMYWLQTDPSRIAVRLTCTIACPVRTIIQPERTTQAGTAFDTTEWHDRGALGQLRRTGNSILPAYYGQGAFVTVDGTPDIIGLASAVRELTQDRLTEASLPIEWPDEDIQLTDCIDRIEGIEFPLGVGAGWTGRFPRVVSLVKNLSADTWNMQITLDTDRKAGIL